MKHLSNLRSAFLVEPLEARVMMSVVSAGFASVEYVLEALANDASLVARGTEVVVFETERDFPALGDRDGLSDIYLWQPETGDVRLLSDDGQTPDSIPGVSVHSNPFVSDDGRTVVWQAVDRTPAGFNSDRLRIMVWDSETDVVRLISPDLVAALGDPYDPDHEKVWLRGLSADGSAVFVTSNIAGLVPDDIDSLADHFVISIDGDAIERLRPEGIETTEGFGSRVASANGRFVVLATREVGVANNDQSWFVHDRQNNTFERIDALDNLLEPLFGEAVASSAKFISDDGRYLGIYTGSARGGRILGVNQIAPDVFVLDLVSGKIIENGYLAGSPDLFYGIDFGYGLEFSSDSRYVAYGIAITSFRSDIDHGIYLEDLVMGTRELVIPVVGYISRYRVMDISADGSRLLVRTPEGLSLIQGEVATESIELPAVAFTPVVVIRPTDHLQDLLRRQFVTLDLGVLDLLDRDGPVRLLPVVF